MERDVRQRRGSGLVRVASVAGTGVTPRVSAAPTMRSCSRVARVARRMSRESRASGVSAIHAMIRSRPRREPPVTSGGSMLIPRGKEAVQVRRHPLRASRRKLFLRRGLDRSEQQPQVELDEVDVGDGDRDVAADHDAGVENAVDEIAEDEVSSSGRGSSATSLARSGTAATGR